MEWDYLLDFFVAEPAGHHTCRWGSCVKRALTFEPFHLAYRVHHVFGIRRTFKVYF